VMIPQPMGGARGQATDIEIQAREIRHTKDVITDILSNATGKPKDLIHKDIDRDFYMGPVQAKDYGLIDSIITGAGTGSLQAALAASKDGAVT